MVNYNETRKIDMAPLFVSKLSYHLRSTNSNLQIWHASCVNSSICCSPLRSPRPIRGIKDGDWCLESILYCELGGDTTTNMFSTLAIVSRLKDLITFFLSPLVQIQCQIHGFNQSLHYICLQHHSTCKSTDKYF